MPTVARFSQQVAEAFDIYAWLYRDAIWRFRWRTFSILALEGLSIAMAMAVVGGVVRAARAIDAGGTIVLPGGWTVLDADSGTGFVGLGVALGMLALASAFTTWITDRIVKQTAVDYQHIGLMRAVHCLAATGSARWTVGSGTSPLAQSRFCTRTAPMILYRWCTWILQTIRPTLLLLLAAAGLLVVNASMTAILLPVLPVYLFSVVRLSQHARRSDEDWRVSRATFQDTLRGWQRDDVDLTEVERLHFDSSRLLRDRRLMVGHGQLVNGAFFGLTLALVFGSAAHEYAAGSTNWAGLVLYVVFLRFVVTGLRINTAMLVRLRYQGRLIEPFRRLIGDLPSPPLSAPAGFERWRGLLLPIEDAASPVTLALILPWQVSAEDLALAETLLEVPLEEFGGIRPIRRSPEVADGIAPEDPKRWSLCLAKHWRRLAQRRSDEPENPAPRGLLLVESMAVSPDRLAQRAGGRRLDAFLVWDGRGWAGVGDADWYERRWESLVANQSSATVGDPPDLGETDDTSSLNL